MAAASPLAPLAVRGGAARPGSRLWLAWAAIFYCASVLTTQPIFIADTVIFAADALRVRTGAARPEALWEFGHLLWRPLAWALTPVFLKAAPAGVAPAASLKIVWGLYGVNLVSGLAVALGMTDLLRRITRSRLAMGAALVILIWGAAFLSYAQSGASYIPALALLVVALWWTVAGRGSPLARAAVAGVLLALSALFWFPFVLAFPAVAVAPLFFGPASPDRRWREPLLTVAIGGVVLAGMIVAGSVAAGFRLGPSPPTPASGGRASAASP